MQNKNYSNSSLYILNNSSWNKWPPLYKPGMSRFENKSSGNSEASQDVFISREVPHFWMFPCTPPSSSNTTADRGDWCKNSTALPSCSPLLPTTTGWWCSYLCTLQVDGTWGHFLKVAHKLALLMPRDCCCCCLADHAKSGCPCFQTKDQRIQKNFNMNVDCLAWLLLRPSSQSSIRHYLVQTKMSRIIILDLQQFYVHSFQKKTAAVEDIFDPHSDCDIGKKEVLF